MEERKEWLRRAQTDEDKILYARVWDMYSEALAEENPVRSPFLSEEQVAKLARDYRRFPYFILDMMFWGGHEDALREVFIFDSSGRKLEELLVEHDPLAYVRLKFPSEADINHRNVLGAVLNLGLERKVLGDILFHDEGADLICLPEASELILSSLDRISHSPVEREVLDSKKELKSNIVDVSLEKLSLNSLRLDALVAAAWRCSRQEAQNFIKQERITVDGILETRPAKNLSFGQMIRFRGKGKVFLKQATGQSRKGRTFIEIERYGS